MRARCIASPLHNHVLYSSVRLLPDGSQLRPISIVRCGGMRALARLAAGTARPCSARAGADSAAPGARCSAARWRHTLHAAAPNRTVLRQALLCLCAGLRERRLSVSDLRSSNRTAQVDYADLVSWVRDVMAVRDAVTPRVCFVKADASKCFDMLEQRAVAEMITTLVPHTTYHVLQFDAIVPSGVASFAAVPPSSGFALRRWSCTVTGDELAAGAVPGAPAGWILEGKPVSESMNGEWVRAVLLHHTQAHVRAICGGLYEQRRGIPQGSAVASVLCDACLTAVDRSLAEVLERYRASDNTVTSLALRRTDDLLVLSTSATAVRECADRIAAGWPDVGFECNPAKLTVDDAGARPAAWCGLLIHTRVPQGRVLECAVDWTRVHPPTLAASCLSDRAQTSEGGLLSAMFRAIRSVQMRFPASVICTTLNSRDRIARNLLEVYTVLASVLCELPLLSLCEARPHPRLFFRARAIAEVSLTHHCERQLASLCAANQSSAPPDLADLSRHASLIAFATTLASFDVARWPPWFRLRRASRIAAAAFRIKAASISGLPVAPP